MKWKLQTAIGCKLMDNGQLEYESQKIFRNT